MMHKPRGRGFTLIELLVVIAIIALLMAILMPALARAKKQVKGVACQSNLHEWGLAFQLFVNDHDDYLMKGPYKGPHGDIDNHKMENYWLMALLPYIGGIMDPCSKASDIFMCPMAAKSLNPDDCIWCPGTTFSAWGPFQPVSWGWWDTVVMGSYGINEWCSNPTSDFYCTLPCEYMWRTPDAKGASNAPLLLDGIWLESLPQHDDEPPPYPDQYDPFGICWIINGMKIFCIDRHSGGINAVFLDWSVRKIGLKELWTLKWHRQYETHGPWTKAGGVQPDDWPQWMRRFKDY